MIKNFFKIIGPLLIIIGLIMIYAGYNMAQGKFYGTVYEKGNYTTLVIGCAWLLVGFFVIIGLYFRNKQIESQDFEDNTTYDVSSSKSNGSGFIPSVIKVLSIIVIVFGIIEIILGFGRSMDVFILRGFGVVLLGFLLFGLSYIVHAAIIYINKQKDR